LGRPRRQRFIKFRKDHHREGAKNRKPDDERSPQVDRSTGNDLNSCDKHQRPIEKQGRRHDAMMAINSVRTSLTANSSKSTPKPIFPNSIPTAIITTPETTAGTQIPRTDSPDANTLGHGEEAHRNHRPGHRISRLCMWKFRRTRHQCHHHQIRTDDRHALKTQRQQLQWRRLFIERVNEIFRAAQPFQKMRGEIGLSQPKDKSSRRAQISQLRNPPWQTISI